LDDNYLSKNNASTQVLYLNKKILSDFFQNENCWTNPPATVKRLQPLLDQDSAAGGVGGWVVGANEKVRGHLHR
jgi:hypothetical protein